MWRRFKKIAHKFYAPLVLLILGLSIFLRLHNLDQPSTYIFDEDMHAYTALLFAQNNPKAYEWWHEPQTVEFEIQPKLFYRPPAVEWLHPPLAKLWQALSINIFGNTAFAWRLPSVLAGVGIVWLVMALSLWATGSKVISFIAGCLACFEPLLQVQSRIASADIFVAFFTLLTVWLYAKHFIIFKHSKSLELKTHKTKVLPQNWPGLLLVGISLGLTTSSKWSGVFLILGLVAFVIVSKKTFSHKIQVWNRLKELTIISSIAGLTYLLTYTQMFFQAKDFGHLIKLHYQAFWYQTHTSFTHPNQSHPLQWLIGQKPVWYYYHPESLGQVKRIIAKPWTLITLLGFLSIILLNTQVTTAQKKLIFTPQVVLKCQFLSLIVLGLYLPWFFITRALFIYQLTAIMPFLIILSTVSIFFVLKSVKLSR